MTGTLVNVAAVLAGSAIGILFRKRLSEKVLATVFQSIGLFTLLLGVMMALKGSQLLVIVFSLILGAVTGQLLNLEEKAEAATLRLKKGLKIGEPKFSEGLVTSFMLFCMGSMTILGAIEEGLGNGSHLLLTKSLMDGFSSMALAAALGIGVAFSTVPMLVFQGGITLLAMCLGHFIPEISIVNLSSVGGIILIGLGINILEIKKIRIMNMLPALIWVLLLSWGYNLLLSVFPSFLI